MVALPPGRGRGATGSWLGGLAAYAVAVPVGTVLTSTMLHVIGRLVWQPPLQLVGLVALVTAFSVGGIMPLPLPTSTWVLPQSWSRFGHPAYAGLFGGLLGLGVVTVISSAGFYAILAYGLTAPYLHGALPVFLVFGVARVLPIVALAIIPLRREVQVHEYLERTSELAKLILPLELALLSAAGVLFLMPGAK